MSDLAKAGVDQLVDVVDKASAAVVASLSATNDALQGAIGIGVHAEDATIKAAIADAEAARVLFIESIKKIADSVTTAL